jgi:hypothetical protein
MSQPTLPAFAMPAPKAAVVPGAAKAKPATTHSGATILVVFHATLSAVFAAPVAFAAVDSAIVHLLKIIYMTMKITNYANKSKPVL